MLKKRYENIIFENDDLRKKDYLNNLIYAEDLAQKIEEYFKSTNTKPLYIAITGAWGAGKTTVALTAIKIIKENNEVKDFLYDAWKYEGDSFRRTFTQNILDNSGIDKNSKEYKEYLNKMYDDKSIEIDSLTGRLEISHHTDTEHSNFNFIILVITIILLCAILSIFFLKEFIIFFTVTISLFYVIGGIKILKFSTDFFNKFLTAKVIHIMPRLFSPEQFYSIVNEILNNIKIKNKIILIDNIDRCNDNEFKETIGSIKGFFNEEGKIVYLIPFDKNQFSKAFNNEYQSYSEKIFDYTIDLKEKSQKNIIDFVDKLLIDKKEYFDLFHNEAMDIIAKSDCKTPRQIINICNDYITEYNLFVLRNKLPLDKINSTDLNYLMKYTVLKKYYSKIFDQSHISNDFIKTIEGYAANRLDYSIVKDKYNNIDEKTYLFLRKTSVIVPSNYNFFYSSHSKNDFNIDEDVLSFIQSEQYKKVKDVIINNKPKKIELLQYLKKSIMYEKNKSLWKTNIAPKFRLLIYLLKEGLVLIEEINDYFDYLLNDSYFFEQLFFNGEIELSDVIYFVNTFSLKYPKKFKLKQKLLNGIVEKKFSTNNSDESEIASVIFSELKIDGLNEIQQKYFENHIELLLNQAKYKVEPHLNILSTPLNKYITIPQLKKMLDNLNNSDIKVYEPIVNIIRNTAIESIDNELIVKFRNFINRNHTFFYKSDILQTILKEFYDNKNVTLWKDNINSINLNNTPSECLNDDNLKLIIELYEISGNNSFKTLLYTLNNLQYKSFVLKYIEQKNEINEYLVSLVKEIICRLNIKEFQQEIDTISALYSDLDMVYKTWFNNMIFSKFPEALDDFYLKLFKHEDKELLANYVVNISMSLDEKIKKIIFFTTSNERFEKLIIGQNELKNLEKVLNNLSDAHYREIVIEKMKNIIDGKTSIIGDDLKVFISMMQNDEILLRHKKILLNSLGVKKTNLEDLKTIFEVLPNSPSIKKQYNLIKAILAEHNLLDNQKEKEIDKEQISNI